MCVGNLTIIGSDNGLSPGRRQAIIQNQCWNIVNWTLRNKLQWNFNRNSIIFIQENALQNVVCEMASILSRPQCVKLACIKEKHHRARSHYLGIYWDLNLRANRTQTIKRWIPQSLVHMKVTNVWKLAACSYSMTSKEWTILLFCLLGDNTISCFHISMDLYQTVVIPVS